MTDPDPEIITTHRALSLCRDEGYQVIHVTQPSSPRDPWKVLIQDPKSRTTRAFYTGSLDLFVPKLADIIKRANQEGFTSLSWLEACILLGSGGYMTQHRRPVEARAKNEYYFALPAPNNGPSFKFTYCGDQPVIKLVA